MEIKFGENALTGIMRTAAKALFAWYLTDAILGTLKEHSPILLSAFKGNCFLYNLLELSQRYCNYFNY